MNDGAISVDGWDIVSTFSDVNGKKIFSFGLAYENIDCFTKDVLAIQKNILKQKPNH